jgi:serine-type D-Ala-D-Ala carboxypeptidase (penicillin-binding protein 5/6)
MALPIGHKKPLTIYNTNPLIEMAGVNGLKTGYTINAGWCLVTTCNKNGRFYISIITGCKTKTVRNAFGRSLLLWGEAAIGKL